MFYKILFTFIFIFSSFGTIYTNCSAEVITKMILGKESTYSQCVIPVENTPFLANLTFDGHTYISKKKKQWKSYPVFNLNIEIKPNTTVPINELPTMQFPQKAFSFTNLKTLGNSYFDLVTDAELTIQRLDGEYIYYVDEDNVEIYQKGYNYYVPASLSLRFSGVTASYCPPFSSPERSPDDYHKAPFAYTLINSMTTDHSPINISIKYVNNKYSYTTNDMKTLNITIPSYIIEEWQSICNFTTDMIPS